MVKYVRIPLTDISNKDLMSGNVIEIQSSITPETIKIKSDEWMNKQKPNEHGQIYVDGLGRVKK